MRLSRFFIDRPIFAAVIAVLISVVGAISYFFLPVSQYPDIVPPTVTVTAAYPGASAETVADTVANPIEQEINGVEGMLYQSSQSTGDGRVVITVTFAQGTDLDAALSRHPQLGRALLRRSQEDLHESRELMALTSRRDAGERVATLLYSFAEAASDSPCHPAPEFELPLKRSEMAQLLNLTVETVSRNLTRLEGAGLIRRKGARGIELRDPARLAQLAGAVT